MKLRANMPSVIIAPSNTSVGHSYGESPSGVAYIGHLLNRTCVCMIGPLGPLANSMTRYKDLRRTSE